MFCVVLVFYLQIEVSVHVGQNNVILNGKKLIVLVKNIILSTFAND